MTNYTTANTVRAVEEAERRTYEGEALLRLTNWVDAIVSATPDESILDGLPPVPIVLVKEATCLRSC